MHEKSIETFYEILELKVGASQNEIKDAYRDLAKVWHPDRFSHDPKLQIKAEEKLKLINQAYEKLRSYNYEPNNFSERREKRSETKPKTETFWGQIKQPSQTKREQNRYQANDQTKNQKYQRKAQKESFAFEAAKKNESKSAFSPLKLGIIVFGIFVVFVFKSSQSFPGNLISTQPAINRTEINANKGLDGKSGAETSGKAKESDSVFQHSLAKTNPNSTKLGNVRQNPIQRNTTDSSVRNQMLTIQNSITIGNRQKQLKGLNQSNDKVAIGSTKDEVLGVYGYPAISSKKQFRYNDSVVYFDNDRVSGVKQVAQEKRIILRAQQ
jgi:curved DNA-binding protein CbpA